MQPTQGEVKDADGQVKHRSDLDELLGMSTSSMDFALGLKLKRKLQSWSFGMCLWCDLFTYLGDQDWGDGTSRGHFLRRY